MKKFLSFVFVAVLVLLWSASSMAAGSVVVSLGPIELRPAMPGDVVQRVLFTCTGDASDGSIPNTTISTGVTNAIKGFWLCQVSAYPVSGGTAPDAADVFILDEHSEDLLGSTDNTTADRGANLIHATLGRSTIPKAAIPAESYYPKIRGPLTLKVSNQATASAEYVVELVFFR